jgi:DNA-directed RNA polymerase alpha subunit
MSHQRKIKKAKQCESASASQRMPNRSVGKQEFQTTRTRAAQAMSRVSDDLKSIMHQITEIFDCIDAANDAIENSLDVHMLELFKRPVSEINLTKAARSVLLKKGINTVGHVVCLTPAGLEHLPNSNSKIAREIERAMNDMGIPIGFSVARMRLCYGIGAFL